MTELRVAYHEAGHAVVARLSPHTARILRITLDHGAIGEGQVLWVRSGDGPSALWTDITVHLAGIAAEMSEFSRARSGTSAQDLQRAIDVAHQLVELHAFEPPWKDDRPEEGAFDPSRMYVGIPAAEARIMRLAYAHARGIIDRNEALVERVSEALLERGHLEEPEVRKLFKSVTI